LGQSTKYHVFKTVCIVNRLAGVFFWADFGQLTKYHVFKTVCIVNR